MLQVCTMIRSIIDTQSWCCYLTLLHCSEVYMYISHIVVCYLLRHCLKFQIRFTVCMAVNVNFCLSSNVLVLFANFIKNNYNLIFPRDRAQISVNSRFFFFNLEKKLYFLYKLINNFIKSHYYHYLKQNCFNLKKKKLIFYKPTYIFMV